MKLQISIKLFYTPIFLVVISNFSSAQAILTVNGAKINMTNGVIVSTNNLSVSNSGSITAAGSTLKIAGSITSSGAIDVSKGLLEMNGTTAQEVNAASLSGKFVKSLTINNSSGVTVQDSLKLTDVLTVANGNLISGGFLTLKSSDTATARIAPVTSLASSPISGNVIVERFISAKRANRFLSAPVNSAGSIRDNWMEGVNNTSTSDNNNPVMNYGTHITGTGGSTNGFDPTYTNNPSLYTFNSTTQAWVAETSTGGQLKAGSPYLIFVRGSRSTNLNSNTAPPSPTTLRAKGSVLTGTVVLKSHGAGGSPGMPEISTTTAAYTFIANPYASPVDWSLLDLTDISPTIYIFDPNISGSKGQGGYVAFNRSTGVSSNNSSKIDNNIQSGQAFFVQTTGPNPSLTFKETYKSGMHRAVFRTQNCQPQLSVYLLTQQEKNSGTVDALSAYFSNNFSSSIGNEDSYKFANPDENLAILKNGKTLCIEGRKPVTTADTLPLKIWQLSSKNYAIKVIIRNFADNTESYLEDAFLHTSTRLSNDTATILPFTITPDTMSFAPERFRIVFKNSVTPPPAITRVKAYARNKGVEVEWAMGSEKDSERFVVEKSSTTQQFTAVAFVKSKVADSSSISSDYSWFDEIPYSGNNYYRIKFIKNSGEVAYSRIMKVYMDVNEHISVVSGQSKSSSIEIFFKNVRKGNYVIALVNSSGQKVYNGNILHDGGSTSEVIQLKNLLPSGIYHLQVSGVDKLENLPVLIQ